MGKYSLYRRIKEEIRVNWKYYLWYSFLWITILTWIFIWANEIWEDLR
jgi:hypothetical protein